MTNEQLLKMAGWFFFFLACLLPVYSEWASKLGPDWLSEETAVTSAILLAVLFLWTGGKLMLGRGDGDDIDNSGL